MRKWLSTWGKNTPTATQKRISHTENSQPLERIPTWVNDEDENAQEPNREGEDTTRKIMEVKTAPKLPCMSKKMKNVDVCPNGMHFWVFTCPKSQNWFSPNLNFLPILLPSPCNNYFNQFLQELNDWVNETRKVVDCFMGSPFDIWIFPIGPKG